MLVCRRRTNCCWHSIVIAVKSIYNTLHVPVYIYSVCRYKNLKIHSTTMGIGIRLIWFIWPISTLPPTQPRLLLLCLRTSCNARLAQQQKQQLQTECEEQLRNATVAVRPYTCCILCTVPCSPYFAPRIWSSDKFAVED